jgi:hypothetical protein
MSTHELIGADDAARFLGMSKSGLILATHEGRIPLAGRVGVRGVLVYDRAELEPLAAAETEGVRS